MLQQTQVDRVIPRWRAWLERWPTVESLAAASPAEVIVEWQGLGYNRRAVSLHRAAQHVAARGWPDDLTELPGVGPYTAAAVGNFAFGRDVLPVDTNVQRDPGAHRRALRRRLRAGALRSRRDRLPRPDPTLRRVPARGTRAPSRGRRYEPLRRQSRFEGSFRQRRAVALRAVAAGEHSPDGEALVSLERDGLVVLRNGIASLPLALAERQQRALVLEQEALQRAARRRSRSASRRRRSPGGTAARPAPGSGRSRHRPPAQRPARARAGAPARRSSPSARTGSSRARASSGAGTRCRRGRAEGRTRSTHRRSRRRAARPHRRGRRSRRRGRGPTSTT